MQYFNIQMASQLSGVASATIRAWEKRYQAVTPQRAENKHRLYSEKDIEKLSLLAKITDYGQNIGKIAKLDLEELKNIYSKLINKPYEIDLLAPSSKEKVNFEKTITNLILAITSFKMDVITHELKKVSQNASAREVALNLISPLHQVIEQKMKEGEITQSHRHALDHILLFQLSTLLADHDFSYTEKPPLILAAPLNETRVMKIFGAALLCTHYQKNFLYLGTAVSAKTLAEAVNSIKSEAILLSTHDYQLDDETSLDHFLDEFNRSLRHSLRIFIAGPPSLVQSTTRKNCVFIHNLSEIDQKLADNRM